MSDDQGKVEDRPKRNDLPARAAKRIVATIFARSSFKADDPKYDPMIPLRLAPVSWIAEYRADKKNLGQRQQNRTRDDDRTARLKPPATKGDLEEGA